MNQSSPRLAVSAGGMSFSLREDPVIQDRMIISQQLMISGDVETNPGPIACESLSHKIHIRDKLLCYCVADRPRPDQLILLKIPDGSNLQVQKWITSLELWQCEDFALMLLKDDVQVNKYRRECKGKDEFVRTVLRDWLSRDDDDSTDSAVPRSWAALAECVTDAGLDGALAKAIRDSCSAGVLSTNQSCTICTPTYRCVIFFLSQINLLPHPLLHLLLLHTLLP